MAMLTKWALIASAFLLTIFGVFILPFLVPPHIITNISAANAAGFNNRVAVWAAAGMSLLATAILLRFPIAVRLPQSGDCLPMSRRFILGWSLGVGALAAFGVQMIYGANIRYASDYGYFIGQATSAADYGRKLYSEVEFPYGPLLFYPPIWIRELFQWCARPLAAAYCVVYVSEVIGGLLLVAYVLQCLPVEKQLRRAVFVALAIASLNPAFGVNYTFFRFATPLAVFLFSIRSRRFAIAASLLLLGQLLTLGISPEMGFAFGAGVVGYAGLRVLRREFRWLAVICIPLIGGALFLLLVGRGYLHALSLFSAGTYNLIVEPEPHVLLYLVALIWLVPAGMAAWRRDGREEGDLFFGIYVIGLALVPVAFGRADVGHVIYNGLPILLLALIPVSAWRPIWRVAWTVAIFAVIFIGENVAYTLYQGPLKFAALIHVVQAVPLSIRQEIVHRHPPNHAASAQLLLEPAVSFRFDADQVQKIVGTSKVVTPLLIPLHVEEALRRRNLYSPGYYFFEAGVFGRNSELRQIADMNNSRWALIPQGEFGNVETPKSTAFILGVSLPYRQRRPAYVVGPLFTANLQKNWHVAAIVDSYTLYRRNW